MARSTLRLLPIGAILVLTTVLAPAGTGAGGATAATWTHYHNDAAHDGNAGTTPAIALPAHRLWASKLLDGAVYAEPLVANGVVIEATENNSVYGLAISDGRQLWKAHLATPVTRADLPNGCGNIAPLGITSTPVVDTATQEVFVLAEVRLGARTAEHELFGLHVADGSIAVGPVNVDVPGWSANQIIHTQQRGALALAHGKVLIPYGGLDGDCAPYRGSVVAAPETGTGPVATFSVKAKGTGIWAASGPAVDRADNIYVATGNGTTTGPGPQDTNSVIKLATGTAGGAPTLTKQSEFTASTWARDNANDTDLGSAGPMVLGTSGLLYQQGKDPVGYLLTTAGLGGTGGAAFSGAVKCSSFGGEAYAAPTIYVACISGGLQALTVTLGASPSFTSQWVSTAPGDGPPVVGGGWVWTEDWQSGNLYAVNPANGKTAQKIALGATPQGHFLTPAVVNGLIIVPGERQVLAFAGKGRHSG